MQDSLQVIGSDITEYWFSHLYLTMIWFAPRKQKHVSDVID